MTPPFSAVSKSCDPPSVSTPLPLLVSDKSLTPLPPPPPPITASSPQRPLSSIPKVAVVERFDCISFTRKSLALLYFQQTLIRGSQPSHEKVPAGTLLMWPDRGVWSFVDCMLIMIDVVYCTNSNGKPHTSLICIRFLSLWMFSAAYQKSLKENVLVRSPSSILVKLKIRFNLIQRYANLD